MGLWKPRAIDTGNPYVPNRKQRRRGHSIYNAGFEPVWVWGRAAPPHFRVQRVVQAIYKRVQFPWKGLFRVLHSVGLWSYAFCLRSIRSLSRASSFVVRTLIDAHKQETAILILASTRQRNCTRHHSTLFNHITTNACLASIYKRAKSVPRVSEPRRSQKKAYLTTPSLEKLYPNPVRVLNVSPTTAFDVHLQNSRIPSFSCFL